MRKNLVLIMSLLLAASCSSPKYTYNFDYYDYNSGKKQKNEPSVAKTLPAAEANSLIIKEESLTASASKDPALSATNPIASEEAKSIFAKKYKAMTQEERKEFRQEVKKELKQYVKAKKNGDNITAPSGTTAMDNDLKMAIIFGAVGLTLTLFGGVNEAFWILGVIAIVVGVVFLIKWLVRQ